MEAAQVSGVLPRSDGTGEFGEDCCELMPLGDIHAEFVVAAMETSHVRKLSSDDLGGGWEGLGFVVGDSVLQAVEQDAEVAVGQVSRGGAVGIAGLASAVVMSARSRRVGE